MSKIHTILLIITILLISGCAAASTPPAATTSAPRQKVVVGVGFIPNVQFAPLYVAQQKGFFADEGLDVTMEYGYENDFVALAAQGEREFAVASGDQVILARGQGLPITYVMKWYQRYPVALLMGPGQHIDQPAQVAGKRIGIPGLFGASFIGWKALAYAAHINEAEVILQEIGFTQAAAIQQGTVDGAIVYLANEPVQLRRLGVETQVILVSDYIDLVSNGLVAGDKLMAEQPELVQKMVRATLRGLQYTIDHPDEAFAIARTVIPEMTDTDAPTQREVLDTSIGLWRSDRPGLSDQKSWQESVDFMTATGMLEGTEQVEVDKLYTNRFIEAQ